MSSGTPGALKDVAIITCWYLWPDRPAEKKYLYQLDYEAAVAKEPWAWSREPPKAPPVSKSHER